MKVFRDVSRNNKDQFVFGPEDDQSHHRLHQHAACSRNTSPAVLQLGCVPLGLPCAPLMFQGGAVHPTGIRHICRFTSLHAADAHLQDREASYLHRVTVMSAAIRYHGPPDPPGLPSGVLVVKVYLP